MVGYKNCRFHTVKRRLQEGGGGQKLLILHSKKMTKKGEGGKKSPILRRHSLWTAPNQANA